MRSNHSLRPFGRIAAINVGDEVAGGEIAYYCQAEQYVISVSDKNRVFRRSSNLMEFMVLIGSCQGAFVFVCYYIRLEYCLMLTAVGHDRARRPDYAPPLYLLLILFLFQYLNSALACSLLLSLIQRST